MVEQYYILNSSNKPIPVDDMITWLRWWIDNKHRSYIVKSQVGDMLISTIWINIWSQPIEDISNIDLFEIMVFSTDYRGLVWRFRDIDRAVQKHNKIVEIMSCLNKNPLDNSMIIQEYMYG